MSTTRAARPARETISVRLTDQNVSDLLSCAGFGIGYWAESATVDEDAKTYRVLESSLELPDGDKPADKVLTFAEIRAAFNKLGETGYLPDWQIREIKENNLGFDAEVADMTVQMAMFGEITYG